MSNYSKLVDAENLLDGTEIPLWQAFKIYMAKVEDFDTMLNSSYKEHLRDFQLFQETIEAVAKARIALKNLKDSCY
jgi:hypothetical protein